MVHSFDETDDKIARRARRKSARRDAKRDEIAASALDALRVLGYANVTLRDIAAKSGMPLGSISYYFTDKSDLITYCVRLYKLEFIKNVQKAVQGADSRESLIDRFADALTRASVDDRSTHKLWYDIRTQAMFDPAFRPVVNEIESKMIQTFASSVGTEKSDGTDKIALGYAMIDGVFRYLVQSGHTQELPPQEVGNRFKAVLQQLL